MYGQLDLIESGWHCAGYWIPESEPESRNYTRRGMGEDRGWSERAGEPWQGGWGGEGCAQPGSGQALDPASSTYAKRLAGWRDPGEKWMNSWLTSRLTD